MDWTYLGHAGWLVEAEGLRLLFDPLLRDPHHGGTYEVFPARTVHAERLRPDFVFVSHAHPDHFDVRSLARLAALDADSVVVTPDALVAEVAARLGFRSVKSVAPASEIALDRVRVVLTPSRADDPEWGAIVETSEGAVWNQVDTVLSGPGEVRRVLAGARLAAGVSLALVRWQPLLEIEAQVPGSLAFPFRTYGALLEDIAAIDARALVPAAAGQRHVGGAAWLDRVSSPLREARFLRDVTARAPATRALPARVGATYRVRGGETSIEERTEPLLTLAADERDPRVFRGLEVPPVGPGTLREPEAALRARLDAWVRGELAAALARAWPSFGVDDESRLGLEIAAQGGAMTCTIAVGPHGTARVAGGLDDDLDALDVVSAAGLADVLDGVRAWGDVLLAGELRASLRAYRVTTEGLSIPSIGATFLYYALPYAASTRRAVLRQLDEALATSSARS